MRDLDTAEKLAAEIAISSALTGNGARPIAIERMDVDAYVIVRQGVMTQRVLATEDRVRELNRRNVALKDERRASSEG